MRKLFLVLAIISTVSGRGWASEPCTENSNNVAETAYQLLKQAKKVKTICADCGDEKPQTIQKIEELAWEAGRVNGKNVYSVVVNDEVLDLATTFIEVDGTYQNLGVLAGCPNQDDTLTQLNLRFQK